jgi:gamma-glutamyltranspeptidase
VVSAMDPHGSILDFLDLSRYYFFQVAPQLCTLYPQMLVLTSPTSGGRSVGIVCLQTKATE